jgi:uncharacterized protein YjbJ (UPF0337 family)
MSRKNRPQHHEPVEPVVGGAEIPIEDTLEVGKVEVGDIVLVEDPIDGTVEVGTVLMVDGPFEPVPLAEGVGAGYAGEDYSPEIVTVTDFSEDASSSAPDDMAALSEFSALDDHNSPQSIAPTQHEAPTVDTGAVAGKASDAVGQARDAIGQIQDKVQDKAQDMAQNVTQAAQGVADKAQNTAQGVADKAQDAAQTAANKAKDAAQKIADTASTAKNAAADAGSKSKSAVAGAASIAGMSVWSLVQRNPLQAILFLFSLVWLIRSNNATASQPAVSPSDAAGDAAEKMGTVAGQVQVAAGNLGSQVQSQAQAGAGWFSKTLQSNPLAIGAMGIVFGAGLGFAVPETSYEHKTLGKTRDALADKAQAAAQDLGHKVTTVAQTAVHEAIESGKEEAKNQGLVPQEAAAQEPAPQDQAPQQ